MGHLYTVGLRVRHHELDAFGRVYPAAYLRWLAQAAVEASADAGFDTVWYDRAGALWLVRRSLLDVARPARAGERLEVLTWVEDFRRVRSNRRYELRDAAGGLVVSAVTDWVYVDVVTGRPRRVPEEMERGFGFEPATPGTPRAPWAAPPPPPEPARTEHRVGFAELDALAHMNNAAYLDLVTQATLDALEGVGWPLDRLVAGGAAPLVVAADLEYLDAARYGDRLEAVTWFVARDDRLEVYQIVSRTSDGRPVVRAATTWRWAHAASHALVPPPAGLEAALATVRAA